ncbi:MAG TPA: PTS sugar transporter subunit IIA [Acidobacteriota bacterium]|nr:PTS sugar transporter subunit IIA [Acidobacteriota bacterium]
MKVSHLITNNMVMLDLESESRDEVIKEMVSFMKERKKEIKEKDLYERLIQREKLGSTAIGNGFAIPHCKVKSAKDLTVLLGISRKGVEFHSPDNKLSHVFFLVVSSPDNPSVNLQALAAIAHLIRKSKNLIDKIFKAKNISEVLSVIQEEEENIDE